MKKFIGIIFTAAALLAALAAGGCVSPNGADNAQLYVTYFANGGTGSVPSDTEAYFGGDTVTVPDNDAEAPLTREGYVFLGWTDESTGGDYFPGSRFVITSDKQLSAKWSEVLEGEYALAEITEQTGAEGAVLSSSSDERLMGMLTGYSAAKIVFLADGTFSAEFTPPSPLGAEPGTEGGRYYLEGDELVLYDHSYMAGSGKKSGPHVLGADGSLRLTRTDEDGDSPRVVTYVLTRADEGE